MNKISNFGAVNITMKESVLTNLVPQNITKKFLEVKFVQHSSMDFPILMTYNVTNYTSTRIEIKITFDKPLLVSSNLSKATKF
jgi:hypothetical protein